MNVNFVNSSTRTSTSATPNLSTLLETTGKLTLTSKEKSGAKTTTTHMKLLLVVSWVLLQNPLTSEYYKKNFVQIRFKTSGIICSTSIRRSTFFILLLYTFLVLLTLNIFLHRYTFVPTALDFYQTSLRDPVFWQMYSKILKYFIEYKKFLTPYTQDSLHYVGVKINDVKVEKLVTFFEYYDFDVSNNVFYSQNELKSEKMPYFTVRQPRINHKAFNVEVDVKSDVEGDAVFKFFLGPKYDSKGYPISLEDNWMNFVELDWFVEKLTKGQNKIVRSSNDFFFYKEDSAPIWELLKLLNEGKVPTDMSIESGAFPKRLILPRGHKGGYPYQIFVMVYPYSPAEKKFETIKAFVSDNKPLGYPFDRPVHEVYFKQPNMFFEDVEIYHEGEMLPYKYNVPYYTAHYNDVAKH